MLSLFIKAFVFGIAVAAPVGPMGVLCMRRILVQGWKSGTATALGIAASDGVFAAIAALGLTGISKFILSNEAVFHLVAGIIIGFFGVKIFYSKVEPITLDNEPYSVSLPYAFSSAFLMTLTNPLTILFFVTAFTALTPASGFDHLSGTIAITSIFLGSFSWYAGVIVSVSHFRNVISNNTRRLIDKLTGAFLIILGIWEMCQII